MFYSDPWENLSFVLLRCYFDLFGAFRNSICLKWDMFIMDYRSFVVLNKLDVWLLLLFYHRKDKHALQKLHREVERAKRTLSYLNETTIEVEDLGNTEDFSHTLTRTIFEALTIVGFKLVSINFYSFVYRVKHKQ